MANLSILVPICNVEKYLEQCLQSIINQTYTNLQIICVDDGSTDASPEILDEMAARDKRIEVIHKANSGYGSSMNLALSLARGEYVGIVESDDYIAPDMYERLMARVELGEHVDIVKSTHYAVEMEQARKVDLFEDEDCERVITAEACKTLFAIPCNIWSGIYRRDFLEKNKISFLETPGASYQDTSFFFKTMMMAEKIVLTNEAYYYYRIDNASSSVHSNQKIFCVCDEIKEIDRYRKEQAITNPYYEGVRNAFTFRAYYWNYNRLDTVLKSAFYQEFSKELSRMQSAESFKEAYWTRDYWNAINHILRDREQFFWDSVRSTRVAELDGYTKQKAIYGENLENYIKEQDRILIYGAGVVGERVYSYLCKLGMEEKTQGFVVSKKTEAIPAIDSVEADRDKTLLIVAVAEKHQLSMLQTAQKLGFTRILRADEALWKRIENMEK